MGGPSAVPGSGDQVYFGAGGSNTSSTMDLGSITVDRVVMDANYTAALTIPVGNTLNTNNHFVQYGTLNMLGGTLNADGYFNINGGVVADGNSLMTSTLSTNGSFFLNQTGSITAQNSAMPTLVISSSGFDHGGTIAVGVNNTSSELIINGPFVQQLAAVTNVNSGSTLTFTPGPSGGNPTVKGTMNLNSTDSSGASTVVTANNLQFDGGVLNSLTVGGSGGAAAAVRQRTL